MGFHDRDELAKDYSHDWSDGELATRPFLNVGVYTENGGKDADNEPQDAQSMRVTILAPGQVK